MSNSSEGYLIVRVTTAGGALPIAGATVTVRPDDAAAASPLLVRTTASGGVTPRMALPAPAIVRQALGEIVAAVYHIEAAAPGYRTAVYQSAPIYAGVTAIQTADLVPLAEGEAQGSTTYFEGGQPDL